MKKLLLVFSVFFSLMDTSFGELAVRILTPQETVSNIVVIAPNSRVRFRGRATGNLGGPYICWKWDFGGSSVASPGSTESELGDLHGTTQSVGVRFKAEATGKEIPITVNVKDQCRQTAAANLKIVIPWVDLTPRTQGINTPNNAPNTSPNNPATYNASDFFGDPAYGPERESEQLRTLGVRIDQVFTPQGAIKGSIEFKGDISPLTIPSNLEFRFRQKVLAEVIFNDFDNDPNNGNEIRRVHAPGPDELAPRSVDNVPTSNSDSSQLSIFMRDDPSDIPQAGAFRVRRRMNLETWVEVKIGSNWIKCSKTIYWYLRAAGHRDGPNQPLQIDSQAPPEDNRIGFSQQKINGTTKLTWDLQ